MTKADRRLQCAFRIMTMLAVGGIFLVVVWEFIKEVFK